MRQGIRDFVKIVSEILPSPEPVYEFGAWQSQPGFSDMRSFFPGKHYYGFDIRRGIGVDAILDLHQSALPDNSAGVVLLLETLEHVQFPLKALAEVYRMLRPNGMVIMSSQMNYPIHDTHDYWRFTPEGFLTLLRDFPTRFVQCAGGDSFPPAIVGVGLKGHLADEVRQKVTSQLTLWKDSWDAHSVAEGFERGGRWKPLVKMLTPPLLLQLYRKLRGGGRGVTQTVGQG